MSRDVAGSVVTGSAAQLPDRDPRKKLGDLKLSHSSLTLMEKNIWSGVNLTPSELYQNMRSNQLEVKTASPTVGQYYEVFKN